MTLINFSNLLLLLVLYENVNSINLQNKIILISDRGYVNDLSYNQNSAIGNDKTDQSNNDLQFPELQGNDNCVDLDYPGKDGTPSHFNEEEEFVPSLATYDYYDHNRIKLPTGSKPIYYAESPGSVPFVPIPDRTVTQDSLSVSADNTVPAAVNNVHSARESTSEELDTLSSGSNRRVEGSNDISLNDTSLNVTAPLSLSLNETFTNATLSSANETTSESNTTATIIPMIINDETNSTDLSGINASHSNINNANLTFENLLLRNDPNTTAVDVSKNTTEMTAGSNDTISSTNPVEPVVEPLIDTPTGITETTNSTGTEAEANATLSEVPNVLNVENSTPTNAENITPTNLIDGTTDSSSISSTSSSDVEEGFAAITSNMNLRLADNINLNTTNTNNLEELLNDTSLNLSDTIPINITDLNLTSLYNGTDSTSSSSFSTDDIPLNISLLTPDELIKLNSLNLTPITNDTSSSNDNAITTIATPRGTTTVFATNRPTPTPTPEPTKPAEVVANPTPATVVVNPTPAPAPVIVNPTPSVSSLDVTTNLPPVINTSTVNMVNNVLSTLDKPTITALGETLLNITPHNNKTTTNSTTPKFTLSTNSTNATHLNNTNSTTHGQVNSTENATAVSKDGVYLNSFVFTIAIVLFNLLL